MCYKILEISAPSAESFIRNGPHVQRDNNFTAEHTFLVIITLRRNLTDLLAVVFYSPPLE